MAEQQEDRSREDLTEEASPYRIEEFRRKGQVAQSKELSGLVALLAAGVATYSLSPQMGGQLAEFMREVFRADLSAKVDLGQGHIVGDYFMKALRVLGASALPICLIGFFLGVVGSFAQIGSIFSLDPLTPDWSRLSPLKGLQRIISLRQLMDSFRLIFKMVVTLTIAYALIKTEVLISPSHLNQTPMDTDRKSVV